MKSENISPPTAEIAVVLPSTGAEREVIQLLNTIPPLETDST